MAPGLIVTTDAVFASSRVLCAQWYTEKYTAAFGDELDMVRKQPGFGGREVSQMISSMAAGSAVFRAIDSALMESPGNL